MVPKLTEGGHDFEGAAAYYFADKARLGHARPLTAHRVAWTAIRNLATSDPHDACRIMAATAQCHLALKTAAGIRTSGRKLRKPVLAFSLSWHPSERPTRGDQLAAAEASLAALGLAAHQAVIVAHSDEPQAHVHCIVNRVEPTTGRAASLSKSKLALSKWAEAYERGQGRILCVERVENNARRAGHRPGRASANRSPKVSRAEYRAGGAREPGAAALRQQHAEAFSIERGRVHQARAARRGEAAAFYAGQKAARRAIRDRLTARPTADAETRARLAALLVSDRPEAILSELTRSRSTFTRREMDRLLALHTDDTAGFAAARAAIEASGALIHVGRDARGLDRFTTAGHQRLERRMLALAAELDRLRHAARPVPARFHGLALSDDQDAALSHILGASRIAAVTGVAGAGKSTMINAARQSWQAAGFRVQGLALAAEAAAGLKAGARIASGTIHSRLYLWEQGRQLPGPKDVLVVDEAGMIGSRQMERLLHFAQQGGAKLVLVGDARQLQAIEAGGAFRAIADRVGAAALKTVRRQVVDWQRQATGELATGQITTALARYEAAGMVHGHSTDAAAQAALIDAWHRHRIACPDDTQLIMAFLRRDVAGLNALARARLRVNGTLGPDVELHTASGRYSFAVHDRLYFSRNDAKLNVRNGSLATIEAIHGRSLTVRLDDEPSRPLTFSLDDYGHIAHGYAATIHKTQGATVDRAHLYCSRNLDQHAAYVAMTRHRQRLDLHWSRESIPTRQRLTAILSRLSMKDTSFDYASTPAAQNEARREAADDTHARIRARSQTFADREKTATGRVMNARALLAANASASDLARLALNAVDRRLLFRLRQNRLRQWTREILPSVAVVRPIHPTRTASDALLDHSHATLQDWQDMETRHAAERCQEQVDRKALQREAAANWRAHSLTVRATARFAFGCRGVVAFRAAAAFPRANDNPLPSPAPYSLAYSFPALLFALKIGRL